MPKDLPEEWLSGKQKSLKVSELVRNAPERLFIFKTEGYRQTKYLQCRWMPMPKSIDIRPNEGRNSSGKRLPYKASTGFEDPYKAAKAAVRWWEELQEDIDKQKQKQKYNSRHSLHYYWEIYYQDLLDSDKSQRVKDDTLGRWNGKGWGVSEQKWSRKSIDEVDALDIAAYFKLLDARGSGKKGSMAEQKKNQKTLLNHLNKLARIDFPKLQPFLYPTISEPDKEVEHFTKKEWETIVKKVIELSGGNAQKFLTEKEYQNLEWDKQNIFNQRNWVDFYDCLHLNWFFYLRPRDLPPIKSQWFTDDPDNKRVILYLEETKLDRPKHKTFHYRPDGYKFWKRMKKRRPKGYLSYPFYPRKEGEESRSNVGQTLNRMLRKVVELCRIKKREKVVWGIVRHTAFRLTLDEMPELGSQPDIHTFSSNGHTSPEMLEKTYLKSVDREKVAGKAMKKLKPSTYSLIKRVSVDD